MCSLIKQRTPPRDWETYGAVAAAVLWPRLAPSAINVGFLRDGDSAAAGAVEEKW